ncbi:hypothetical protein KOR34_40420 [Posidoniimonas corsicana]|uniref:Organic solvent tolerance-like N-terminal domain-containing protein n=1 Tax=Posidoniimonas corsicana TaxID=1938618 RepID=A0A5C5V2R4_9BACT|nr:hypothetical protein [Posidoniimonas corsicana]TWT32280.1 hypothetical protein KOR34_40420 [Posidoniimonas corsicana]
MLHAIMLAVLVSGVADPVDHADAPPRAAATDNQERSAIELRFGGAAFTAKRLGCSGSPASQGKQPAAGKSPTTLVLESARCSIGGGEIVITADRMLVDVDGANARSISGVGNCRYVSAEEHGMKAAAKRLQLTDAGLSLEGEVELVCSNGTVIAGDSVRTSSDGSGKMKLVVLGATTLMVDD